MIIMHWHIWQKLLTLENCNTMCTLKWIMNKTSPKILPCQGTPIKTGWASDNTNTEQPVIDKKGMKWTSPIQFSMDFIEWNFSRSSAWLIASTALDKSTNTQRVHFFFQPVSHGINKVSNFVAYQDMLWSSRIQW